ncbi:MAG: hypothetical protein H6985_20060 [Pseudomonadales bacterium]|nr:hypothetical protein [Pseudomonadales bacterium]
MKPGIGQQGVGHPANELHRSSLAVNCTASHYSWNKQCPIPKPAQPQRGYDSACSGHPRPRLMARILALLVAIAMFVFSLWMYSRTGDWVAIVFAIGSAAYGTYFFNSVRKQ